VAVFGRAHLPHTATSTCAWCCVERASQRLTFVMIGNRRRALCGSCWEAWADGLPSLSQSRTGGYRMTDFEVLEPLVGAERERMLAELARERSGRRAHLAEYVEALRTWEPNKLYPLRARDAGQQALWFRYNAAARMLGLQLHWPSGKPAAARYGKAREFIYAELTTPRPQPSPSRNGHVREPMAAR
jgi:hypothetical protein